MRQILGTSSGAIVARMPRPVAESGSVLIRVHYSFISAGTELAPLRSTVVAADAPPAEKVEAYVNVSRAYIAAAIRNPAAAVRFAARLTREKLAQLKGQAAAPAPQQAEPDRDETGDQGWNL